MHNILIIGSGKIGALVAGLLDDSGDYNVAVADRDLNSADIKRLLRVKPNLQTVTIEIDNHQSLKKLLKQHTFDAIVSCLPYHLNLPIAEAAKAFKIHYFDLTEDTQTSAAIKELAQDAENVFVPQCGLAPGFIGIVAHSLVQDFEQLDSVKLRAGALPAQVNNALHYSLTWSTEGIINQYGNRCSVISNGKKIYVDPLNGLEAIQVDGMNYEAFNTSGGIGNLIDLHVGKVNKMNYKTIRYPGHCKLMRFLMQDLRLNEDREMLKQILEKVIPKTYQDVVLIYVAVNGKRNGEFLEETFVKKIYHQTLFGLRWSAIQISTAAGLCVVLDMVLSEKDQYHGFVYQEQFALKDVLANKFGRYFV